MNWPLNNGKQRVGIVKCAPEFLELLLGFRAVGFRIVHVRDNPDWDGTFELCVEGNRLQTVPTGAVIPNVTVEYENDTVGTAAKIISVNGHTVGEGEGA